VGEGEPVTPLLQSLQCRHDQVVECVGEQWGQDRARDRLIYLPLYLVKCAYFMGGLPFPHCLVTFMSAAATKLHLHPLFI
jgi:hypothetical protein